ncbi:hypothetical protein EJV47_05970 [Hymenobacter gummosus]|uniref:DUF3298 domain-containing protein n=1 Tax=Hymenobacter gummosus TaxID=1776032 RepID=A0A431U7E1_9BACT|nr:hypothetical protein [Hymenobacter gummosus]RTQ52556.1 hypothetical protein EJV47_05970 [Hymenobacter gummosus]
MLPNYCRRLPLGLLALSLLAACETRRPATEQAASAPATTDSAAVIDSAPAAPQPAPAAPLTGYHRYVGTVGKAPVVLELTISPPDAEEKEWRLYGTYYYERQGAPLILSAAGAYQPGQPLALKEETPKPDEPAETLPSGRWRATQAAGPVLSGTWESPDGRRRLPFSLREDYAGALRYELLTEKAAGPPCPPTEDQAGPRRPEAERTFLHLLGPDTLQPALRALQAPLPEQRRNQLAVELDGVDCEGTFGFYGGVEVALNGYGLLSVVTSEGEDSGGAYPNSAEELTTYDLRTGRALKLADWLQPGQEPALRRLLQQSLRAHPYASSLGLEAADLSKADLAGLGFDSEGVYCLLGDFGAPHAVQRVPVVVPYRALRPLLQPGSAVARMLRQRGLW